MTKSAESVGFGADELQGSQDHLLLAVIRNEVAPGVLTAHLAPYIEYTQALSRIRVYPDSLPEVGIY